MSLSKILTLGAIGLTSIFAQSKDKQGEQQFKDLQVLAQSLVGKAYPRGAAQKVIPALEALKGTSPNMNKFANYANDKASQARLLDYLASFDQADDTMFGETDRTYAELFKHNGDDKCYNEFANIFDTVYVGWQRWQYQYTGKSEIQGDYSLENFCRNNPNYEEVVDMLIDIVLGKGKCDALEVLYNGKVESNIWAGYRDNIADKGGYWILNLAQAITVLDACDDYKYKDKDHDYKGDVEDWKDKDDEEDYKEDNDHDRKDKRKERRKRRDRKYRKDKDDKHDKDDKDDKDYKDRKDDKKDNDYKDDKKDRDDKDKSRRWAYYEKYQKAIERVLKYDDIAYNQIDKKLSENLEMLLQDHQGVSLELMALNVNGYYLNLIYNDWDLTMIALNSDVKDKQFYYECNNCLSMTEGEYSVLVEYFRDGTTPAFDQHSLESIKDRKKLSDKDLADKIWNELGDCLSGVALLDKDVDYYVDNNQGDRFIEAEGKSRNIFIWGVKEECHGRPDKH
eukprot:403345877